MSVSRRRAAGAAILVTFVGASSAHASEYVPGQVIVKFRDAVSAAERAAALERAGVVRNLGTIPGLGSKVVRVRGDAQRAAARLDRAAAVEYAEVDHILTATAVPNDPLVGDQWALDKIDAPQGWTAAGLGAFPATGGVRIGIIDTGIDTAHPEFAGKIAACGQSDGFFGVGTAVRAGCGDEHGHGTKTAGILAARANNGLGVSGVAFNSSLAVCKALQDGIGRGSTSNVVSCIGWVRSKGAKVISMSFGGAGSSTLRTAVKDAWSNGYGAVLVAAAGNDSGSMTMYPAGYPEVISVAAIDPLDAPAGSNRNADVEMAAPGLDVLSTTKGGYFGTIGGSSAATPHVAGVAAVMRQRYATESANKIRNRLTASAVDLGEPGRDPLFGFGRANLCRAVGGTC